MIDFLDLALGIFSLLEWAYKLVLTKLDGYHVITFRRELKHLMYM